MARRLARVVGAAFTILVGFACNSIAGIDGIDGRECSTTSECPDLGECVTTTCDDGLCRHELAQARSSCSAGICDGTSRCVRCITADDCKPDPFLQLCTDDGRCVECIDEKDCKDPLKPRCPKNACIQCQSDEQCAPVPEPCLAAKCLMDGCVVIAKPAMDECPMEGLCDGKGNCEPKP